MMLRENLMLTTPVLTPKATENNNSLTSRG
jgi:hypothetical protein